MNNLPLQPLVWQDLDEDNMWAGRNLVYAENLDSRDELCSQIEKLEYKDDE